MNYLTKMSIAAKVIEVEALFEIVDIEIKSFQDTTKLSCIQGCGKCCTHSEVDASPLEFLPWAYQLFLSGDANHVLEQLSNCKSSICHIYQPFGLIEEGAGSCSNYLFRGLICRLFGYGATTDKYGKLRLATCKLIKENQVVVFKNAEKLIEDGIPVPVFTHYYLRLMQIDFQLGKTIVPINLALKLAIEEVLHYYSYHDLEDEIKVVA
jgi:Fe-S-cluster containining protein